MFRLSLAEVASGSGISSKPVAVRILDAKSKWPLPHFPVRLGELIEEEPASIGLGTQTMRTRSELPSSNLITADAAGRRIVCPSKNTWTFGESGIGCEFLEDGPAIARVAWNRMVRRASHPIHVEQNPPAFVGATQSTRLP
jgi:hypothetical protein